MEISPARLRDAARRRDALAADLDDAGARLRATPTGGFDDAAGEAALLLETADTALSSLRSDVDRVVDGLLLTARLAADADDRVAAEFERTRPGAGQ